MTSVRPGSTPISRPMTMPIDQHRRCDRGEAVEESEAELLQDIVHVRARPSVNAERGEDETCVT